MASALAGVMSFHVGLAPTWWLIPAALLVSLTWASLGYAIGTLMQPTLAHLVSQVLLFIVMLFTPISFPIERLPQWAQAIHNGYHWNQWHRPSAERSPPRTSASRPTPG
jgi:ABC-2 type transport system permease protein